MRKTGFFFKSLCIVTNNHFFFLSYSMFSFAFFFVIGLLASFSAEKVEEREGEKRDKEKKYKTKLRRRKRNELKRGKY